MASSLWCVGDGTDAVQWPSLQLPPVADASTVPPEWNEALMQYAKEWLEMPPGAAWSPAEAEASLPRVSPVAALNALLVSAATPELSIQSSSASMNKAFKAHDARPPRTLLLEVPPTIALTDDTLSDSATRVLRHSRWIATGLSHSAGTAPRLPSAVLLSNAYRYAIVPACNVAVSVAQKTGAMSLDMLMDKSVAASGYRGAMVLLLFHPVRILRVWARDQLLRCMKPPRDPTDAAGVTSAVGTERRLRTLLFFALQLLCTLKHISILPEQVSFLSSKSETKAEPTGSSDSGAGARVLQGRVEVVVSGLAHLFTILASWEAQFGDALDSFTAASAGGKSAMALLVRCRSTVGLLGGSFVLYSLQSVHIALTRAVTEARLQQMQSQVQSSPQNLFTANYGRAADDRAAQVSLHHITQPLNRFLAVNPPMPRPYAVTGLALRKTLLKVIVHCLLDNATGLAATPANEAWRHGRLRWLWTFAAAIDPPSARVAPPLLSAEAAAASPADAVMVPGKSSGWLLKPLLKNAAQQFQWASAVATAKGRPSATPPPEPAAAQAAEDATCVLDRAVYGLQLLLDSLATALPAMLTTVYAHDVCVSHESDMLALAIGGIVHTRSRHALRLHELLLLMDVQCFAAASNLVAQESPEQRAWTPFRAVPTSCLQRVWLTLPTLVLQVCKTIPLRTASTTDTVLTKPLPLPSVLARLFTVLCVLSCAPAASWLLLSPLEAMGLAPPPLRWVVQRCLRSLGDMMREHHAVLERAWLGPVGEGNAAPTAAVVSVAAAGRLLREEKALARLIFLLPHASAVGEDAGLRRLCDELGNVFAAGVTPAVADALSAEEARWLWSEVVLQQPALLSAGTTIWDVTSSAVANVARAQGRHWLRLLSHCCWDQVEVLAVRCGWWACALLADVVSLKGEERRTLAEKVLLRLPTEAMLFAPCARTTPYTASHVQPTPSRNSEEGDAEADVGAPHSPEWVQQAAADKAEEQQLYAVVQHLLLQVLHKVELYPRELVERLVRHVSKGLAAPRANRDRELHRTLQPALVHAFSRRPELEQTLQDGTEPVWLRQCVETTVRAMQLRQAAQERCFQQYEWEEEAMRRQTDDAAQVAVAETQLRRGNEVRRVAELTSERVAANAAESAAPASRLLRQQQLFPNRPATVPIVTGDEGAVVKRGRSRTPPPGLTALNTTTGSTSNDSDSVVELEVDSDVEEMMSDTTVLDRLAAEATAHPSPLPRAAAVPPLKTPRTATTTTATAVAPTKLQQKLQVINARNTHRVHHAEQLRALQERLVRVAARTNLSHVQPPLINDIIGPAPDCMAAEVPVLPEVFVAAAAVMRYDGLPNSSTSVSTPMPLGDAASAYAARFAPHIALELRSDILRNYEELIEGVRRCGGGGEGTGKKHAPEEPLESGVQWARLLPVHPCISAKCIAVQNTGVMPQTAVAQAAASGAYDSLGFRFQICASSYGPTHLRQQSQLSLDPVVRAVAAQGLSAGLSEGDVVAVLLPLHTVAPFLLEKDLGVSLQTLPLTQQSAKAAELLGRLPRSWRELGCIPQICHVQSLLPGERFAILYASAPTEPSSPRTSTTPARPVEVPPTRFLHALRMAYSSPVNAFYLSKLTALNAAQMELAALNQVDHTRFALTIYDPRHVAEGSVLYHNWITSLLSIQSSDGVSPLSLLRPRLLLQRQLNDWQVRAIIAMLHAACPEWDEGEAQRSAKTVAPRAPEVLVIEGPPGTGKTQTIGSLTLNLLHHLIRTRGTRARLLVCAPSNCAVDEALLRVLRLRESVVAQSGVGAYTSSNNNSSASSGYPPDPRPNLDVLSGGILRIGVRDRVDIEVLKLSEPVFLDDVVEQRMRGSTTNNTGANNRGGGGGGGKTGGAGMRSAVRTGVIESASMIFSTLGSLHHITRQVHGLQFDVVIVDEASQATEPAVLQALVLARHKVILVGDSKQLQPTILSTDARRHGLQRSLLVRMLACGHRSFLLRTQYRMHPDICAFPNAYFYQSQLLTDRSVRQRWRLPESAEARFSLDRTRDMSTAQKLGRWPRFVFVDVPDTSMKRRRGRSLFNEKEAAAVVLYMRQLRTFLGLSVAEMGHQVGIITFYKAQVDTILSMLSPKERECGLQVATVDSFQGKEKTVILLSCVRTVRRAQLVHLPPTPTATDTARTSPYKHHHNTAGRQVERETFEERAASRRVGRFGLGFLADGHRLNVALTRAQDLCIIVGNADSLHAVREAVIAARIPPASQASTRALLTADSTFAEVLRQLDSTEEDPLAITEMLVHAEGHDVWMRSLSPSSMASSQAETESVVIVEDASSGAAVSAACVRYDAKNQLTVELAARAREARRSGVAISQERV